MTAFVRAFNFPPSQLPPLSEILDNIRERDSKQVVQSTEGKRRQVSVVDREASQIARDFALAKQLAKVDLLVNDERANRRRRANVKDAKDLYEDIRAANPDMNWSAAWDLAQVQHAEQNAATSRMAKRARDA